MTASYSLVGSVGAVSSAAADTAVTPGWGAGSSQTLGNLLICWVGGCQHSTAPTTPSNWQVGQQQTSTECSATVFYKIATGGDGAPTIAAKSSTVWNVQLAEFAPGSGSPAVDQSGTASGTTSPIVATAGSTDAAAGDLVCTAAGLTYTGATSKTITDTYNNGASATQTDNNGTSITGHYDFGYGFTTGNSSDSSDSLAFTTTQINSAALVIVTFGLLSGNVSTVNGLAAASISSVSGVTFANVSTINGVMN